MVPAGSLAPLLSRRSNRGLAPGAAIRSVPFNDISRGMFLTRGASVGQKASGWRRQPNLARSFIKAAERRSEPSAGLRIATIAGDLHLV
jgi:hypothetical protein